jgi:hypothetical protein
MKLANADCCEATTRPPNSAKMTIIGNNHIFLRTRKNAHKSVINSIIKTDSPIAL